LNRRGVSSPTGRPFWGQGPVKKLLNNRVYLGEMEWGKRRSGKFFTVVDCEVTQRKGPRREERTLPSERTRVPQRHEALTDPDTFERVQAKLVANRNRKRLVPGNPFVLSGLLVCGHCGRRMVGRTHTPRQDRPRTYRVHTCGGYNVYGASFCQRNTIDEAAITSALLTRLQSEFLNPQTLEAVRAEVRRQDEDALAVPLAAWDRQRERLGALEQKLTRGVERLLGVDDALVPAAREQLRKWHAERDEVAAELERLAVVRTDPADLEAGVDEAVALMGRLQEAITADDADALRVVLAEALDHVELFFAHQPVKRGTRSVFVRGLAYPRNDVAVQYTSVHRSRSRSV
jgi:hypothetical protein